MKDKGKNISHEDVQRALRSFQERGGLIRTLPAQLAPDRLLVGARHGLYEPVLNSTAAQQG